MALATTVALGVGACGASTERTVDPGPGASAEPTTGLEQRPASRSALRVENHAAGRDRRLIRIAVIDLKRVGLWDELTRDTYVVYIATRRGGQHVPPDGHLADAVPTALVDDRGSGRVCDIRFYSTAMSREIRIRARLYELGRSSRPPPAERIFWAAVLAHELAHCIGVAGRGEAVARRWERRALRALERRL